MSDTTPHIPDGLIYGPVPSRRFGRSIGVSLSRPDCFACRWRCPYCQVAHLPRAHPAGCFASVGEILTAVRHHLAQAPTRADVLCVAGGGEPSDHPAFAELMPALRELAEAHGLPGVLLTNGDGLTDAGKRDAIAGWQTWLKWDPGPREGAWRRLSLEQRARRREQFATLPARRVQALLFAGPGTATGNCIAKQLQRWSQELVELRPQQVHLTTIDRPPLTDGLRPVAEGLLQRWSRRLQRSLGVPVAYFN